MAVLSLDLMPIEEKPPEPLPPKTIVVRFGYLLHIGEFPSDITSKIGCGTKVVVKTDRGTELAEMLTTTCSNGGCSKSISREKLLTYIEASGGPDYPFFEGGRVLRVATVQDLAEQSKLDENKRKHINMSRELVVRHNLDMKIVEVEYLLGGERVTFYFTSEHRIDFRSLVRDMAHELHTRIELRQVGARDDARLTADYEKCGQHCCCKQFLKVLTPISMKSAKIQKATLDPAKISGRCGRLMCCLRYEDQTYEELRKKLPKRNTRVKTEKGDAWVVDGQILTQLVLVQFDDFKREAIPMEQIQAFDQPKPKMADGRTMQSPNDRPPMQAADPAARAGAPGAPVNRAAPVNRPAGDNRAAGGNPRPIGAPTQSAPSSNSPAPQQPTPPDTDPAALTHGMIEPGLPPIEPPAPAEPTAGPIAQSPAPFPQNRPPQGRAPMAQAGRPPLPGERPMGSAPPRGPQGPRPPQQPRGNFPPRPQGGPPQQGQRPPQGPRPQGPQNQQDAPSQGQQGPRPPAPGQAPRFGGPRPPRGNQIFRPQPGTPAQGPQGDPLSTTGPTGGDLNTGSDQPLPQAEASQPQPPQDIQPPANDPPQA